MKPRVFVGSSSESLGVAHAIQANMERAAEVTVWTQGFFELSKSSLESLTDGTRAFDAAVFVFTPDDLVTMRRTEMRVPRDNVVFELGLFMGALGRNRVYFVVPQGETNLHLPTDILGVTPATFDSKRSDGNLEAALAVACNKILAQLVKLSLKRRPSEPPVETHVSTLALTDVEASAIIDAWLLRTVVDVLMQPMSHAEIDEQLHLQPGTSARLTKVVVNASRRGLKVVVDNGAVVQIVER
ncbi:nucleotide-binding protein [Myxococcus eversor]|uniref:nucleotide-binding protein n=1 Tax=Myxococcus eversor TaxID=2709661 RepID=UPI0013D76A82|nr:nucleotide-binding protein [Myxococcus eversor]